jgi:hypothetical protein
MGEFYRSARELWVTAVGGEYERQIVAVVLCVGET